MKVMIEFTLISIPVSVRACRSPQHIVNLSRQNKLLNNKIKFAGLAV